MQHSIYRNPILLLLICSFFTFPKFVNAQIAAYTTMQNEVMVWDDGLIRKIDYLRPVEMKVGRVAMAYLDNSRNFKIYHKAGVTEINRGFTNHFQVTDNLITYQNASALYVWENGKTKLLTKSFGDFYTADSLVVYFDNLRKTFNAYYGGNVTELEGFLAGNNYQNIFLTGEDVMITSQDIAQGQLASIKVSDNLAAYINYSNQFKCFYKGMIWDMEDFGVQNYGVGRNTIAYTDNNSHFKIMHNGAIDVYEQFAPIQYAVGDDVVAYIGQDNRFRIFYNDSIYELGSFEPHFQVKDNIVAYKNSRGYFSVFYKGKTYELEAFMPDNIKISYNSLVYVNRANMIRMFSQGKTFDVVTADVPWWEMQYDIFTYRFGSNLFKVFYQGEVY